MSKVSSVLLTFVTVFILATIPALLAAQVSGPPPLPPKRIDIVFGGPVDSQLVSRVTEFIETELTVNLVARTPLTDLKDGFDELTKELAATVNASSEICLLAVVAAPWKSQRQGSVYEPLHVGILNISALTVTSDDDTPLSRKEQFERRVEKEALRAMALLCGLKPCPFPQCCLYEHQNEQELDRKARNLCPPCHSKAMDALRKASVPVGDKDVSGSK